MTIVREVLLLWCFLGESFQVRPIINPPPPLLKRIKYGIVHLRDCFLFQKIIKLLRKLKEEFQKPYTFLENKRHFIHYWTPNEHIIPKFFLNLNDKPFIFKNMIQLIVQIINIVLSNFRSHVFLNSNKSINNKKKLELLF